MYTVIAIISFAVVFLIFAPILIGKIECDRIKLPPEFVQNLKPFQTDVNREYSELYTTTTKTGDHFDYSTLQAKIADKGGDVAKCGVYAKEKCGKPLDNMKLEYIKIPSAYYPSNIYSRSPMIMTSNRIGGRSQIGESSSMRKTPIAWLK